MPKVQIGGFKMCGKTKPLLNFKRYRLIHKEHWTLIVAKVSVGIPADKLEVSVGMESAFVTAFPGSSDEYVHLF